MLILAVALYDFIPANVSVPETITYTSDTTTTSIKQEIAYTNGGDTTADTNQTDEQLVTSLKSYSIDSSDLTVYGEKNLYNSGNSNPFDYASEQQPATTPEQNPATTNNNSNQTQSGSDNQTTNSTTNTSTPGTFFESPTTK